MKLEIFVVQHILYNAVCSKMQVSESPFFSQSILSWNLQSPLSYLCTFMSETGQPLLIQQED